jgi:hypothetical protein
VLPFANSGPDFGSGAFKKRQRLSKLYLTAKYTRRRVAVAIAQEKSPATIDSSRDTNSSKPFSPCKTSSGLMSVRGRCWCAHLAKNSSGMIRRSAKAFGRLPLGLTVHCLFEHRTVDLKEPCCQTDRVGMSTCHG